MCTSWRARKLLRRRPLPGRKRVGEQVGSSSQVGAELGLQERQSSFAAPADCVAGQRAAGEALASCSVGDLQGLGIPAATLGRLVETFCGG